MTKLISQTINSDYKELVIQTGQSERNNINYNSGWPESIELEIIILRDSPNKYIQLLSCDQLDVSEGRVLRLSSITGSFNGDLNLIVRDKGEVILHNKNTITISDMSAKLKITLTTPESNQTSIKNTEQLIYFAQSIINLPKDVKNIKYVDYNLARKVKKINNLPDSPYVNSYKLTLHSPEVENSAKNIENKVNENFYKFYAVFNEADKNFFKDLPTEIIGQIGSYLQDGDIELSL